MTSLRRRDLFQGAAALLVGAGAADRAYANAVAELRGRPVARDRVWLRRLDGQEIVARHRIDGAYDDNALLHLGWFMRDLRDRDHAVWMEPRLFDLLAGVQAAMSAIHGAPLPIVVTSGYRTPAHNAHVEGAARDSLHLYGYASDVPGAGLSPARGGPGRRSLCRRWRHRPLRRLHPSRRVAAAVLARQAAPPSAAPLPRSRRRARNSRSPARPGRLSTGVSS